MDLALQAVRAPRRLAPVTPRVVMICALAGLTGLAAGVVAQGLTRVIGLITNVCFYGRLSTAFVSPADNHLGLLVVLVPIAGGLLVGGMARFGSDAIRGHGIPEAMEQVLFNESRVPARLTLLKPLSAAIAIGTGGPFGAEGPIIATGGALGSVVGQVLSISADERKTLLAAGAAGGMAATFGSPVSAVLLAIELLLFEYHPRSVIPVALASVAATAVRIGFVGAGPMFATPALGPPTSASLAYFVVLGTVVGLGSVYVTRLLYWLEDRFERLPIHWMWWPAIGAVVVGGVGYVAPRTLGVGYDNIEQIVSGTLTGRVVIALTIWKLVSWSVALASGTSGGTLAPLFTIGAGCGAVLTEMVSQLAPGIGLDPRLGALVGMAAMFAGASHAVLASVVFAFEITRQPFGLLPVLGGCAAAFLVSSYCMRHSIMTEKIARRGAPVPSGYAVDFFETLLVQEVASRAPVTLSAEDTLAVARARILAGAPELSHQGFPVTDARGLLVGVVTRRELLDPTHAGERRIREVIRRPPAVVFEDSSLREAADHMVREGIGRLPVVARAAPRRVTGMVTRSDLLAAHRRRLDEAQRVKRL